MDLGHIVFDLVIFIITNNYGNFGMVLDELKHDCSRWLCEEKIAKM